MDVNKFLNELDKLYAEKSMDEVADFLDESMDQAELEKDKSAMLTILNEMMGFFRERSMFDDALEVCDEAICLMDDMGIKGTVEYATSMQNIANCYRAVGRLRESLNCYGEVKEIYEQSIPADDYRFASLYNNMALLFQNLNKFENAVDYLKEAAAIMEKKEGGKIQLATTYANLGTCLVQIGETQEAVEYINKALEIFGKDEVKDFHYSAALTALGSAMFMMGEYDKAEAAYLEALDEIELNMGKGVAYKVTESNLKRVQDEKKRQAEEQ